MITLRTQRGLTLIEILVSVTVSLILLSGVLQVFQSSKITYRLNEELARLQEIGRIAADILAREIRHIGYQGCADPETIPANVIADNPPTTDFTLTGVRAYEIGSGAWSPTAPAGLPATVTDENGNDYTLATLPLSNTDLIIIQYASPTGAQTTEDETVINANIKINSNPSNLQADDVIMISDCDTADIFRATTVSESSGKINIAHSNAKNTSNNLSKSYPAGARVMRFESNMFFVAPAHNIDGSDKVNERGFAVNALYRVDIYGNLISLLEGVDNMQLSMGERLGTNNLRYLDADGTGLDISQVESIKVGLLISTVESVTPAADTKTYLVAGTSIAPAGTTGAVETYPLDKRVRRVVSKTINLRNRR